MESQEKLKIYLNILFCLVDYCWGIIVVILLIFDHGSLWLALLCCLLILIILLLCFVCWFHSSLEGAFHASSCSNTRTSHALVAHLYVLQSAKSSNKLATIYHSSSSHMNFVAHAQWHITMSKYNKTLLLVSS